jgi:hypothetical protein
MRFMFLLLLCIPGRADLFEVTGTYTQAFGNMGQHEPNSPILGKHRYGWLTTDEACDICTRGHGLESLIMDVPDVYLPGMQEQTSQFFRDSLTFTADFWIAGTFGEFAIGHPCFLGTEGPLVS